jgi:hypothetical protein
MESESKHSIKDSVISDESYYEELPQDSCLAFFSDYEKNNQERLNKYWSYVQ